MRLLPRKFIGIKACFDVFVDLLIINVIVTKIKKSYSPKKKFVIVFL